METKSALFADDVLLFSSNPAHDVPEVQRVFHEFGRFSGLKINFAKSKIFILTKAARGDWITHTPIKVAGASIKYLGINIGKEPSS